MTPMLHSRVMRGAAWTLSALLVCSAAGCEQTKTTVPVGEPPMKLTITSKAFGDGQNIPTKYTGDGQDVSPPLAWSDVPPETKELALIVDDPDAPSPQPWVHWVAYKIPADVAELAEGIAAKAELTAPAGALQGKNSWGSIGYRGPAPPPGGVHHYYFKLYALDAKLNLTPGAGKDALLAAMNPHILAEGKLIGTYKR